VFYVIEGVMTFRVGDEWLDAAKGAFVLVPGGVTHDFENRSAARAGVLNLSIPGAFEQHMPTSKETGQYFPDDLPLPNDHPAHLVFDGAEHTDKFFNTFFR